ncbi:MAG: hypothetical protein F6J98_26915 [Moorea sp. SIO4G2]|uniref:hypothetical protein n=1 Tax=Moorena sp. SIO4A5 TaxID=2607838 RepID=UPI0013CCFCF7|nr:hypothetical protein [Moorena sp. SIO4A5]NEO20607.1 hypothetical protein [Moorena sp. SIO4A5]NEO63859.1 hypothetical protein [Moorena sp. SIO4G2]
MAPKNHNYLCGMGICGMGILPVALMGIWWNGHLWNGHLARSLDGHLWNGHLARSFLAADPVGAMGILLWNGHLACDNFRAGCPKTGYRENECEPVPNRCR